MVKPDNCLLFSSFLQNNKMAQFASPQLVVTDESRPVVFRSLNYPAIQSLRLEQVCFSVNIVLPFQDDCLSLQCQTFDMNGRVVTVDQTVLTCSKLILPQAMTQVCSQSMLAII